MNVKLNIFVLCLMIVFIGCIDQIEHIQKETDFGYVDYYIDQDSLKQGAFLRFDRLGGDTIEHANYKNDTLDGVRRIYTKGLLEVEEYYRSGILDGPYTTFYDNGQVQIESSYKEGVMSGILKKYYPTGTLEEKVTMKDNVENGPFVAYHPNGKIHWRGTFINGDNEIGLLEGYDTLGQLVRKMDCGVFHDKYICQDIWTREEGNIEPKITFKTTNF